MFPADFHALRLLVWNHLASCRRHQPWFSLLDTHISHLVSLNLRGLVKAQVQKYLHNKRLNVILLQHPLPVWCLMRAIREGFDHHDDKINGSCVTLHIHHTEVHYNTSDSDNISRIEWHLWSALQPCSAFVALHRPQSHNVHKRLNVSKNESNSTNNLWECEIIFRWCTLII